MYFCSERYARACKRYFSSWQGQRRHRELETFIKVMLIHSPSPKSPLKMQEKTTPRKKKNLCCKVKYRRYRSLKLNQAVKPKSGSSPLLSSVSVLQTPLRAQVDTSPSFHAEYRISLILAFSTCFNSAPEYYFNKEL